MPCAALHILSGIEELLSGLRKDRYADFNVTMLKAFIDDSGSGGDSPWFVLAGYVSSAESWNLFEPEWRAALNAAPKIDYFSSSEAESLRPDGQWAGVTAKERNVKIATLIEVIQRHVHRAIHVRVKQKHYNRVIRANGIPSIWDNPYYFLFPAVLSAGVFAEKYAGSGDPIEFVFDSSEQHEKRSKLQYGQLADIPLLAGRIANVLYRSEKEFLPLQAADLLAWQIRRRFCVTNEPKRPQFEDCQRCAGFPPVFNNIVSEGDLWDMMKALRERDREWAVEHGLPADTEVWKLLGDTKMKL